MLRILIADDHAIVRRGIRQILAEGLQDPEIQEVSDTPGLIEQALSSHWDIIVSDLSMPGGGGLEAIRQIRQAKPDQAILIISIFPDDQFAIRVLRMGASGYLNKDAATDELLHAVNTLLTGSKYIQPVIAEQMAGLVQHPAGLSAHELLSERELEVMKKLVEGKSISEIAGELMVSPNTISTYRSRILQKMGMKSNADIIRYALNNELI